VLEFGATRWINHNISPLTLDISEEHPKRVNLLLATIDFRYVFVVTSACSISLCASVAKDIRRASSFTNRPTGRSRLAPTDPAVSRLTTLFDEVEVISRFDRSLPVEVNPEDRFVATNCWAAHIAHSTARNLVEQRFLFMVQEYEPYFLPMSSISALFQEAYTFPQISLFSTELLRDFFREERIGTFARPGGEADALVFNNAIQRFAPRREALVRSRRRLLFYARPEEHAARNLFELGMIALARLVKDQRVDLASCPSTASAPSTGRTCLSLRQGYRSNSCQNEPAGLHRHDAELRCGLSLMLTPHPSLVPLEMAAAGMLAVTTPRQQDGGAAGRDLDEPHRRRADDRRHPEGLVEAMRRAEDIEGRLAGAQVSWPTDWADAFPEESMRRMRNFVGTP
jgi:hypothetical protein